MRIALDLDGPIYAFHRTYRYMIRKYRGVDMPPVKEFWTHWNAQEQFGHQADHDWMWSEGVRLGLFRYGHMTTGARIGLQSLAQDGHELIIVTHRPESAVTDTLDWVALMFKDIPLSGFHILSDGQPKSVVRADLLIDDKEENCIEWCGTKRQPSLLWDAPYNQNTKEAGVLRAYTWKDVVRLVRYLNA